MPVSSGMSIRMFPLTLEGEWTAVVSESGWVGGVFTRLQTGYFQVKATSNWRKTLSAEDP